MSELSPYVHLPGTAREALTFYGDVFGGEVRLNTYADFGRTDGPADAIAHGDVVGGPVSLFAAVGSEGSVYLTVSKDGGRVQINFANRLREFEAISADGSTIPTGTPIRVQSVTANTLVVAPSDR